MANCVQCIYSLLCELRYARCRAISALHISHIIRNNNNVLHVRVVKLWKPFENSKFIVAMCKHALAKQKQKKWIRRTHRTSVRFNCRITICIWYLLCCRVSSIGSNWLPSAIARVMKMSDSGSMRNSYPRFPGSKVKVQMRNIVSLVQFGSRVFSSDVVCTFF